jgi:hypothetical protein
MLYLWIKDRPRHKLRRLTLELAVLCRSLAAADSGTKLRFTRFSKALAKAETLIKTTGMGRANLLTRLETAGACLERLFLDMQLHGLSPDPESVEALLLTGRALSSQADFLARPADGSALAEAARNIASASKILALAARAADLDGRDFIANLKFSRIYSGLEKTVRAVDDYAELLARTP